MTGPGNAIAIGSLIAGIGVALTTIASTDHTAAESVTASAWFVPGAVCLGLGGLVAFAGVAIAGRQRRQRKSASPLVALFDSNDPQCVQRRESNVPPDLQVRIRVTNVSGTGLRNVRGRFVELPTDHQHYMRIRHDNSAPYALSLEGVDCRPNDSVYFDVVYEYLGIDRLFFQYADPYLIRRQFDNPVRRRAADLEVAFESRWEDDGVAAPSLYMRYRLEPRANDGLALVELPVTNSLVTSGPRAIREFLRKFRSSKVRTDDPARKRHRFEMRNP